MCGRCFFVAVFGLACLLFGICVIIRGDIDHGLVCLRSDRVGDIEKLPVLHEAVDGRKRTAEHREVVEGQIAVVDRKQFVRLDHLVDDRERIEDICLVGARNRDCPVELIAEVGHTDHDENTAHKADGIELAGEQLIALCDADTHDQARPGGDIAELTNQHHYN